MGTVTMKLWRAILAAPLLAIPLLALWPSSVSADGAWLDAPLAPWNIAGGAIPSAPHGSEYVLDEEHCAAARRPVETPEDAAVVASGWTLSGTYESGWGIRLVTGRAADGGMCRPEDYQVFIFVEGRFAGTVSPEPMPSRRTGALLEVTFWNGDELLASFARYAPADALCCPSSRTSVQYRVDRTEAGPVVVPVSKSMSPSSP